MIESGLLAVVQIEVDGGGGGWILLALAIKFLFALIFVAALFALVWLLLGALFDEDEDDWSWDNFFGPRKEEPAAILDRRLAEGQITVSEYKKRKQALAP
jgi:uncharacterized membrane protein